MTDRDATIDALWRARPRSRFVRLSLALTAVLFVGSWFVLDARLPEVFSEAGLERLDRFWNQEVRPAPVRGTAWDWHVVGAWAGDLWSRRGAEAVTITLSISVLAIVLAWFTSLVLAVPASRTVARAMPFLPSGRIPSVPVRLAWRAVVAATRGLLILLRSLPEYVMAYILLQTFGFSAWPAALALAIHNAGILGRLNAEVLENLPNEPLAALRATGASRMDVLALGAFPAAVNRFLLYFFYRWETCVREATVLGMLGVVSLGYWIADARHAGKEDEMVFYILLGAGLVLAGDLLSAVARAVVRRA